MVSNSSFWYHLKYAMLSGLLLLSVEFLGSSCLEQNAPSLVLRILHEEGVPVSIAFVQS